MEDLSHLLPGGPVGCLVPTSQAGGNLTTDSSLAMTAPGPGYDPEMLPVSAGGAGDVGKPPFISVSRPAGVADTHGTPPNP